MKLARTLTLLGVLFLAWAFRLLVLLLALGLLGLRGVPVGWLRPSRRVLGVGAASVLVLTGIVIMLPDGYLR